MNDITVDIFPGGGSNGAFQAGGISAQNQQGYGIQDVIIGTSAGALNGIMKCIGRIELLGKIWNTISASKVRKKQRAALNFVFYKLGIAKPLMGQWSNDPLRDLIRESILGGETLCDYYCGVMVVGDEKTPNRYMKYFIPKGTEFNRGNVDHYTKWILASTAIPVIFEPVDIMGSMVVDGGVETNAPVSDSISGLGATRMNAVLCQPFHRQPVTPPKDILQMGAWTIDALMQANFRVHWREVERYNELAKENPGITLNGRPIRFIGQNLVYPESDLGNSLDFSVEKSKRLFNMGLMQGSKPITFT